MKKIEPPFYAVIFTSKLSGLEMESYEKNALKMEELCASQPGFLGMDSARSHIGITVCYWKTLTDIEDWRNHLDHKTVQERGIEVWYASYDVKVCLVEKHYVFQKEGTPY